MTISTHIQQALRQLASSPLRTFLALLGILVGTASVVAMVSCGLLAQHKILAQFESLGINLLSINVMPQSFGQSSSGPNQQLSVKRVDDMAHISPTIQYVAPYVNVGGEAFYQGHSTTANGVGVTANMARIAQLTLTKGRFFSFLDKQHAFAVIGHDVYEKIRRYSPEVIGTQIRLGENIFTIIGVLDKWKTNFFFSSNFNRAVMIPVEKALTLGKHISISSIAVKLKKTQHLEKLKDNIKQYLQAHAKQSRIFIQSPQSLVKSMKDSSRTMSLLLGLIGSISLIVGGIGVMNIMLVSVAERHKEIGIRLAIGARGWDIQLQFLIEAVVLSFLGGIGGMVLGILVTYFVSLYSNWPFIIFWTPPLLGCGISILIGVFFGFYPARTASKLDPIQTLRSE